MHNTKISVYNLYAIAEKQIIPEITVSGSLLRTRPADTADFFQKKLIIPPSCAIIT